MSEWAKGNYAATTKAATVYEKNGKLLLMLAFDVSGTEMKKATVLTEADGSLNTKNLERMREVFNWDGIDPYWFIENATAGLPCEVEVEMKPGFNDPTKSYPNINWINKAGGGGSEMPAPADRKSTLAKYGSKFRAVAGPQPVGVKPATPVAPPAKPTPPPAPPSAPAPRRPAPPTATVVHATLAECWEMMTTRYPSLSQDAMTDKWYGFIDATGMDQADMTPEGWDKVKASIMADSFIGEPDEEPMPF
jgi:hypothetical protein